MRGVHWCDRGCLVKCTSYLTNYSLFSFAKEQGDSEIRFEWKSLRVSVSVISVQVQPAASLALPFNISANRDYAQTDF